jgi:hypothetical protein
MSERQSTSKTIEDLRVNESNEPIRYRVPAYQRLYSPGDSRRRGAMAPPRLNELRLQRLPF